ncbi:MAG: PD-(D/E)XK nuclease family protein [Coprobacter sp.]|nr:PD-(D/E)XK nuclease family protein [Coprobacter sp.]
MKPFLYRIAETFYRKHADDFPDMAFVFPNRRAGLFFQKYLAEVAGKPIFSPPILTISDLFCELADYQPADKTGMLFILYRKFLELSHTEEPFDNFVFWGEMLLNDFDDVDKYVADPEQLFKNIQDLKEIDEVFDYLTPNQLEAIRQFWAHFIPVNESRKKMEFLAIWQLLHPLYLALRDELHRKGLAYEGMIFRAVAEKAQAKELGPVPYRKIVFIGLNVLSRSEEMVMQRLRDMGIADFYWDYDSPLVQDSYNKASFFLKENRLKYPSKYDISDPDELPEEVPHIEVIGIPSAVGQTKQARAILSDLLRNQAISHPDQAMNTAIVLPDEHLLLPMLYSVPQEINPINVTMGYTLSNTPVAGLMEGIFELQKHLRFMGGIPHFYHQKVLSLLSHRYLLISGENEVTALSEYIRRYNRIFIPEQELARNELLKRIFVPLTRAEEAADYLLSILEYLQQNHEEETGSDENGESLSPIEKEFLYHYYITVNRMKEVMNEQRIEMNVSTFFRLLSKMAGSISIPFRGEPLSGLQIMGILETRALDFDNLIILSMNEGIFPVKKVANTFIPYNLRKGFGLSTTEHQDSIYAYYFYRMIYRAKKIFLIYDTRTEGTNTGEMSRYIYQMKYHFRLPMEEKLVTYDISTHETETLSVQKTGRVQERLRRFLAGGDRALSASAINTYINCPLKFYLQSVEQLSPDDDVAESVEANTFGSIYHHVMECIYNRFKGKLVMGDALAKIQKDNKLLTELIEQAFARCYYQRKTPQRLTGQNYLIGEIIRKYVKKTLDIDRMRTPFIYIESERRMELEHTVSEGLTVRLKAFIDRVDEVNGTVRIIDYKSGAFPSKQKEIVYSQMSELFDKKAKTRPKAVLQVFMYSMMYAQTAPEKIVKPGIYYLRALFKPQFEWEIKAKTADGNETVSDFGKIKTEFTDHFNRCVTEIFDERIPFEQTADTEICKYCDFASICKR